MSITLPAPVRVLIDAANAGDVGQFLAMFGSDGVVDDWGREFRGPQAIRGWSDAEFIGKQVTLDVSDVATVDEECVVTAQVGGNGFNGPSHFSFRLDGEAVTRMTIRA